MLEFIQPGDKLVAVTWCCIAFPDQYVLEMVATGHVETYLRGAAVSVRCSSAQPPYFMTKYVDCIRHKSTLILDREYTYVSSGLSLHIFNHELD